MPCRVELLRPGGNRTPTTYQIQSNNTYYLAFGNDTRGALINVQKTGENSVALDFTKLEHKILVIVVYTDQIVGYGGTIAA
ncbi:hypothetical protein SLS55_010431 [Diplodia seriata]|uniref:Uncharacterized protein n=1 Tax=Diplodia seriata TaxID=420778 RepID=A0ABR3BYI6_9PEZI